MRKPEICLQLYLVSILLNLSNVTKLIIKFDVNEF
jgi:hypothetical protein